MWSLKKLHATDRPMTTPLFLLRCVQLDISIRKLAKKQNENLDELFEVIDILAMAVRWKQNTEAMILQGHTDCPYQ